MSLKSEPYYWVVCDRCGERADYGEFSAMLQPEMAVEYATESEWIVVSGDGTDRHYCDECSIWDDDEDERIPNPAPLEPRS